MRLTLGEGGLLGKGPLAALGKGTPLHVDAATRLAQPPLALLRRA